MEYLRTLSVHFAALVLLFMGVTGLLASIFGNLSFETERSFTSIEAGSRSRRLNAFLATLSLVAGSGILVLAVREFRAPSYALLIVGSLIVVVVVALALKATLRSVEAMESVMAKGVLFLLNGIILVLLVMAAFYVGQYLWRRAFVGRMVMSLLSNSGMHPTANQRASHRRLGRSGVMCAAGKGGRYASSFQSEGTHESRVCDVPRFDYIRGRLRPAQGNEDFPIRDEGRLAHGAGRLPH